MIDVISVQRLKLTEVNIQPWDCDSRPLTPVVCFLTSLRDCGGFSHTLRPKKRFAERTVLDVANANMAADSSRGEVQ